MTNSFWAVICLALSGEGLLAQLQVSGASPLFLTSLDGSGRVNLSEATGKRVKVQYLGATVGSGTEPRIDFPGNIIMFNQTTWTTPAVVEFYLHPFYKHTVGLSNIRLHFSTVDENPASSGVAGINYRHGDFGSETKVDSIVNTYSMAGEAAPGTLVSIAVPSLYSANDVEPVVDMAVQYPRRFGGATITINGQPAPILSVQNKRLQTVIPFELADQPFAEFVVTLAGFGFSAPYRVPLRSSAPALRTVARNGKGQIDARQVGFFQYEGTYNSAEEPAKRGEVLELFATGAGSWGVPLLGDIAIGEPPPPVRGSSGAWLFTAKPVSVTIGGQPAVIYYAGTAPGRPWGVLQVNAFIPDGVGSGPQPIVLKIGDNDNSAQRTTVMIE